VAARRRSVASFALKLFRFSFVPLRVLRGSFFLVVALALAAPPAFAQADYAREQRWADEITPAILVGAAVQLELPSRRKFLGIYAPARAGGPAVIVVHGLGVHPDWNLINALRTQLADQGYATLSIQMPVLGADAKAEQYSPVFPEAAERIAAAARFLRAKGHGKVAVVSHSLGARMANYYVEHATQPPLEAWVSVGITALYTGAERFRLPVLDIYGERDFPAVRDNAPVRAESLRRARGSAQIEVPDADHFFSGHETELVRHVKRFLDQKLR
jgi:pimeloyl-ACP methyl ester carboxylesterase